jgi:hypothetical protein
VQLALVAHNMIRWIALMDAPDRPHYSKKIRRKYIFNAGKLVSQIGGLIFQHNRENQNCFGFVGTIDVWRYHRIGDA